MEEILIIFLILFLAFGFTGDDMPLDISPTEEPEIVEENIAGLNQVKVSEEGNIYREFQGHIAGNSSVEVESRSGDIFIRFTDNITGNARVDIRADQGDIYINFQEKVNGNASVNLVSSRGDITFVNEQSRIEEFINRGNLEIKAEGSVNYRSGSILDFISIAPSSLYISSPKKLSLQG